MSKVWPDVPALLTEAREWAGSYASWGDNGIVDRLADALEAAVPVQGEPSKEREALLWNIEDRLKLLEAGAREPLIRQMAWTEDSTAEVLAIVGELRGWIAALSRATVPDAATDAREHLHAKCDCVPDLGPAHCHLCSNVKGSPVPWGECEAVVAERDAAVAAIERVRAIHAPGKIIDVWGKSRSQADDFLVCVECTDPDNNWCAHPCATVAALDGAPVPEEKP